MIRFLVALTLALALTACVTPRVYTDYNPSAQFGSYRTYSWREKAEQAPPLMQPRIVDAVDAQLRAKGWTPVAEGGDVILAAHVATHREYELDSFYRDPFWGGWGWYGGWGRGWGIGASYGTTRVRSYTVGTLVLDMFDARTKQAIWRASAESTLSKDPRRATANMQAVVAKMFEQFPPGSVPAQ